MFNLIPKSRSDVNAPSMFGNRSYDLFERLFHDFDLTRSKAIDAFFNPRVDVSESDDKLIVKAEVPGIDKDGIDVSLSNGVLTISGEKKAERVENNERRHLVERSSGYFRRRFRVGDDIDPNDIDASYKDGVLEVILPKSEKSAPKKIEVKTGQ